MNFTDTAQLYRDAGWTGALPLPHARKSPPPDGSTGHDGVDLSWPDIVAWGEDIGDAPFNFALRMPATVIGIDVDCYDGKRGAKTLADAENRWGVLPPTFWSTSRADGSGIRYFRVPEGTRLHGVLGDGVEIVQRTHRYSVVAPSVHDKTGEPYRWVHLDGGWAGDIPRVDALPDLPKAWLTGLSVSETTALSGDIDTSGLTFLSDGTMSSPVEERLNQALADLRGGAGSRHDTTRDHVFRLMSMGADGEPGVRPAVTRLRREFIATVGPDRVGGADEARLEFERMVNNKRGRESIAANQSGSSSLWDQTDWLNHIRNTAYSRLLSPAIVLNGMLAYRLGQVPPNVVLPAIVGTEASLNYYGVLYGKSGTGKTTSLALAKELLGTEHWTAPPGSGEKIPGLFVDSMKDELGEHRRIRYAAVVEYDEVTTLAGMAKHAGSTLLGTLASTWSGAGIGAQYQDDTRTHPVAAHTYRFCMTVGVQPFNVGRLMDHVGTGLPQRFVWTGRDPKVAEIAGSSKAPELVKSMDLAPLIFGTTNGLGPRHLVQVEADVCKAVRGAYVRGLRDDASEVDSHRMLLQLKVAAGLSILRPGCDEPVVDDESWRLARIMLTELHDPVMVKARGESRRANKAAAQHQGQMDAEREQSAEDAKVIQQANRLDAKMTSSGMTKKKFADAFNSNQRKQNLDTLVVDHLITSGRWQLRDKRYFSAATATNHAA